METTSGRWCLGLRARILCELEIRDKLEIKTEPQLEEDPGNIQETHRLQRIVGTIGCFQPPDTEKKPKDLCLCL